MEFDIKENGDYMSWDFNRGIRWPDAKHWTYESLNEKGECVAHYDRHTGYCTIAKRSD